MNKERISRIIQIPKLNKVYTRTKNNLKNKKDLHVGFILIIILLNPVKIITTLFNTDHKEAYAMTTKITVKDNAEIAKIKDLQIREGCIFSEHTNENKNGQTTVQMLEISEYQLSDIIIQWEKLGHEINENTIHDEVFIKFLIHNVDIRSFSYTAEVPKFFFLVKNEIPEPMLYGGEIRKFFKTISFPGWFKVAGIIDEQGNYQEGFEHLGSQKEKIITLFSEVLSNTVKGSYTIIELYTDEKGDRRGKFKFFKNFGQAAPTLEEPLDAMAAFGLIYLNLIQENPDNIGVKDDLTKPIVKKLIAKK